MDKPSKALNMTIYLILTILWAIAVWLLDHNEPKGRH